MNYDLLVLLCTGEIIPGSLQGFEAHFYRFEKKWEEREGREGQ
jgi:hypothetical protein